MRTRTLSVSLGLAAAFTFAACDYGGDSGPSTKTVEDPQTIDQGKNTGQTSSQLTALPEGADQQAGKGAISAVGNAMMGWVNTWRASQIQSMAAGAGLTSATHAQVDEASQEFSYTDGHLSANVHYEGTQATIHYAVELDIAETDDGGQSLSGSFDFDLQVNQASFQIDQVFDAEYRDLTLDASGCPIGGGITVDYSFELGGESWDNLPAEAKKQFEQQSGGSGRLVADFGPGCGDIAVEGG